MAPQRPDHHSTQERRDPLPSEVAYHTSCDGRNASCGQSLQPSRLPTRNDGPSGPRCTASWSRALQVTHRRSGMECLSYRSYHLSTLLKAHKLLNAPERVTFSDYGPGPGVAFLREYFRVMGLANKAPAYPLWPFIDDLGGVSWTTWTSKYKFIERSRQLLERAGYPSKHFAGHSYRSGGATDLWESQRCRPLTLKLHGRWKSEAYRVYIRDNPHQTAQEVARALAFFESSADMDIAVRSPPCL